MNVLSKDKRCAIIATLVEGNSMRATARLVDCSFNTVAKLLIEVGRACTKFQDKALRNLPCKRLQVDEVWGFVGAKDLNCSKEKKAQGWGSAWVWTALDADSKLLATWFIARAHRARPQRTNHDGWLRDVSQAGSFSIPRTSRLCATPKNLRCRTDFIRPIQSGAMHGNTARHYFWQSRPETHQHVIR